MLDLRFVRENPDIVRQNIKNKFQDSKLPLVDEVIALDAEDVYKRQIVTGPGSLKEKASRLIREANRQGGIDNIAVVLVNPLGREAGTC